MKCWFGVLSAIIVQAVVATASYNALGHADIVMHPLWSPSNNSCCCLRRSHKDPSDLQPTSEGQGEGGDVVNFTGATSFDLMFRSSNNNSNNEQPLSDDDFLLILSFLVFTIYRFGSGMGNGGALLTASTLVDAPIKP